MRSRASDDRAAQLGSALSRPQKALIPDLIIERGDATIIVDAKYKEHWEDVQEHRWTNLEEEIRERHRADLLQVLAYSTVARPRFWFVWPTPVTRNGGCRFATAIYWPIERRYLLQRDALNWCWSLFRCRHVS
jgi:hypothetical protein